MHNRLSLLHVAGAADASLPAPDGDAGVAWIAAPTLPGSHNGGDWLCRVRASTAAAADAAGATLEQTRGATVHVDRAIFEDGPGGGDWAPSGVYRALLLSVRAGTPAEVIARFETELLAMPRYIDSIRAWRLSRVSASSGSRPWTHVWEQRYDSEQGLTGPYMMHPYHWAVVDRWFDPESPDWIVDTQLCHSFCAWA